MTLVIAGHNSNAPLKDSGLFVAGDSAITAPGSNGKKTLLGGFRKSYEVPIKVWQPYFNGPYFHAYNKTYYESSCFIAIAGSTLTAQHVLNTIYEHLTKLRISYEYDQYGSNGKYSIIRHCQRNILESGQGVDQWDDELFIERDYDGLVSADVIAKQIEYSIRESLRSAKEYKLDENSLRGMFTEFAAGIYCPKDKLHRLFTYRMKLEISDEGLYELKIDANEVPKGNVAVLGMRKQFEERAQSILSECISKGDSPAERIFEFINEAIDEVRSSGGGEIDRPSYLKNFEGGILEKLAFKPR
ncbi:hypothetical protein [Marinobacter nauticus]|uniref:hypothetical protein n=1 Tax=Marinobacter nauticus TaxID=2743 RepID=UPI001C983642|nr:hypothetical protein [Marinobacter nauticus]MBY5938792.1 hypothetical protein [Marinobacter nauticus]MBY5956021.1 hypothetical protein [Marinobacter nauticus]MBY6009812.1 hypothetical protein [Marinobacter nauticus]MBY6103269.1 hypothetical protein [Marinobacter nauticus]